VTAASPDWPADRLGTLERNILRIGVYELEEETVPREVAINEAVVLAKRYATEDAARLVNGILGQVRGRRRVSQVDEALARAEELLGR
jgi:N utilization substance protein B